MDRRLIEAAARRAGLEIDASMTCQLGLFIDRLKEVNQVMNLTTITEDEAIAIQHLEDSWQLVPHIPSGSRVIDVGTGAGFPGLALKIVRPDLDMTLLDATRKKILYLEELILDLGLDRVWAIQGRAEEKGRDPHFREGFQVALARALAPLPQLVELCLPLVGEGGRFIAMKGRDSELGSASNALDRLGGSVEDLLTYQLPQTQEPRTLVLIRKTGPTPAPYPRRMALIKRSPL